MPNVSIVMTAYKRSGLLDTTLHSIERQHYPDTEIIVVEDGFDGGDTKAVAENHGAIYICRKNRPDAPYSNQAVPLNIGIRRAQGEILIIQNAECFHASNDTIQKLVEPHREADNLAVFAAVQAMNQDGRPGAWYCHPEHSKRPYFFCGSVRRKWMEQIRGCDEDFKGYGYEDDMLAFCLQFSKVRFIFRDDLLVKHLWHPSYDCYGMPSNRAAYVQKVEDVMYRKCGVERNAGREWGSLDS